MADREYFVGDQIKADGDYYTILGKIGDIIMWPIIIISLVSSFFMLVNKRQNKLTSVFGYSFVNILSGSMINDGFNVGDTVITKSVDVYSLKIGDIVAFYYLNPQVIESELHLIAKCEKNTGYQVKYDESNITYGVSLDNFEKYENNNEYLETAVNTKRKIYFHRVVGIYVNDQGELFFKTKGSSNYRPDTFLVRQELVVGRYVYTPTFIRGAVSFCSSALGMILLVCLPLCILIFIQMLSIIDQITIINLEKKLLSRKLSIYDKAIKEQLKGNQVELYNKVYYYYIVEDEIKEDVKNYLWKDILTAEELTENQELELNLLNESIDYLKEDAIKYWDEWIENTNGKIKRQIIKYKEEIFKLPQQNELKEKA